MAVLVLGVGGAARTARADWPAARHDGQRSGAAQGKSNIQKPQVAWSAFLGGSLSPLGLLAADIDGDGQTELIRSDGGGITAVRSDGTQAWKQRILSATTLLDVADLDGDGKAELVIYDGLSARVLELATGKSLWAQPPGEMGRLGIVRMRDLDGDGRPELIIGECRGCGGDKPQTGFVYSFSAGFGAPKRVPLPYPDTLVVPESTVMNALGNGGAQLLLRGFGPTFSLVDGATAASLAVTPDLGFGAGGWLPACVARDLDGVPGDEAICFHTIGNDPTPSPTDPSRVFALKYKPGPMPSLEVLWSRSFAPSESISAGGYELLADLDGDGAPETLVTGRSATGTHTIHVLSSITGQEIDSVPGATLIAITPKLPDGRQLFVGSADGGGSTLYRLVQGKIEAQGVLDGTVVQAIDRGRYAVSSANPYRIAALDVDGNGAVEIFTVTDPNGDLRATTVTGGAVNPFGTLVFTPDRPITGLWPLPPIDRPYPQIGLSLADGTLHFADDAFALTSTSIRFGGYYQPGGYRALGYSPIVASLDGAPAQQVVVADSRRVLMRLDATKAKPDVAPAKIWEMPGAFSPIVARSKNGPEIRIFSLHAKPKSNPPVYSLRRLDPSGGIVWEVPIAGAPSSDILASDFDGDGAPDVLLQSGVPLAADLTTAALSGVDGHVLWSTTLPGCMLRDGAAVADWNGDGIDDVVLQSNGTQVLSGVDGSTLATGGTALCYALPLVTDVTADGAADVVITATNSTVSVYGNDLATPLLTTPDADQAFPYAALASCPNGPVLAAGSWTFPSRLKLTTLGGADAGAVKNVFLSGGGLYLDQASADEHGHAQLTAASAHADLTGSGLPTVVVGSGDGFLYAVDPCSGALVFAHDFGAAVGEPIFGDTDGDGLDEILVSVADGYLYALRHEIPVMGTGGGGAGGTGGMSSTTSTSSTSGTGGAGGTSSTSGAGGGPIETYPITGRAGLGCYCGLGAGADARGPAALAFAAGLLAAVARRRRARHQPSD